MHRFIHDDFLLTNGTARELYHTHAKSMPIVDYHCHCSPKDIYEDRRYRDLADICLGEDHYKWRVLRANGIEERFITGNATPREKFNAWASVVPRLIGNPLYHWTHLEQARFFGFYEPLSPKTANAAWETANEALKNLTARKIIAQANVSALCTTDDPADELVWHKRLMQEESFQTLVLPTFRPDRSLHIQKAGFADYIKELSAAAGIDIQTPDDAGEALVRRADYFLKAGCRTADHGLETIAWVEDESAARAAFAAALRGFPPDACGQAAYQTAIMLRLARFYKEHGVVMQIHCGMVRDNSPALLQSFGVDAGGDAISGAAGTGAALGKLLGALERENALPKTVVYSLNPADNAQISAMLGCFQGAGARNRMQHGCAWWFNDTRRGMEEQLMTYAEHSVLPNFIGMLTDSRSPLSYVRHEYFRRVLCNLMGNWVENGEYPRDMEALGQMVEDICYHNALDYFGFAIR